MNHRIAGLLVLFTLTASPSFAQAHIEPMIAFGNRHAVALRTNGDVLTWGENLYCQLGRGSRGNSGRTPTVVMRLRERSRALALQVREIQQAHQRRSVPLILDASATYDLKNIQPGPADRAMRVEPDPSFFDRAAPHRLQLIALMVSFGPKPSGAILEWQTRVREALDLRALAALLR